MLSAKKAATLFLETLCRSTSCTWSAYREAALHGPPSGHEHCLGLGTRQSRHAWPPQGPRYGSAFIA
uniref:Uncharacterized protein n=1 Tax=Ixodes ricinus TaxID=34613 RepID=A0A6B0U0A3_IXORI